MEKPQLQHIAFMDYNDMVSYVYEKYDCEKLAPKWKFWHLILSEAFYGEVSNDSIHELNLGDVFDKVCDKCDDPDESWEAHILARMIKEFGRDPINVRCSWRCVECFLSNTR